MCGREYLVETSQTLLVVGAVTGGVILSALADHVGRKPMVLTCACALGVTAAISAASQSYAAFAMARYFIGVFYSARIFYTSLLCQPTNKHLLLPYEIVDMLLNCSFHRSNIIYTLCVIACKFYFTALQDKVSNCSYSHLCMVQPDIEALTRTEKVHIANLN